MTGLSARNLKYKRAFAEAWPDEPIVQQAVARLPWGHNVRLLEARPPDPSRTPTEIPIACLRGWAFRPNMVGEATHKIDAGWPEALRDPP